MIQVERLELGEKLLKQRDSILREQLDLSYPFLKLKTLFQNFLNLILRFYFKKEELRRVENKTWIINGVVKQENSAV